MLYDDDEILLVPFRSEATSIGMKLKQIAKLKREINEYCTKYAKDS